MCAPSETEREQTDDLMAEVARGGNSNCNAIFYTGEVTYGARRNLPFSLCGREESGVAGEG